MILEGKKQTRVVYGMGDIANETSVKVDGFNQKVEGLLMINELDVEKAIGTAVPLKGELESPLVLEFKNIESLDVLIYKLLKLKEKMACEQSALTQQDDEVFILEFQNDDVEDGLEKHSCDCETCKCKMDDEKTEEEEVPQADKKETEEKIKKESPSAGMNCNCDSGTTEDLMKLLSKIGFNFNYADRPPLNEEELAELTKIVPLMGFDISKFFKKEQ